MLLPNEQELELSAPIYVEQDDQPGIFDEVDRAEMRLTVIQVQQLIDEVTRLFEGGGCIEDLRAVSESIGLLETPASDS